MAFLAPIFLIGMAALALPVLLHLRRNRPKKTVAFSSLMFLEASPQVTKRRARLQDILLLVLRCLALGLLILAFARPYFPAADGTVAVADGGIMRFILLDTSASMRGEPMERALAEAGRIIDGAPEKDAIAVGIFDGGFQALLRPERALEIPEFERKRMARNALAGVKSGWGSSDPGGALVSAVGLVENGMPLRMDWIGDLQKGGIGSRLESEVWRDGVQIVPHGIARKKGWTNGGVRLISRDGDVVRVRVTNAEGSAKKDFELRWSGMEEGMRVSVMPGESDVFEAPGEAGGGGWVVLEGDDYDFDNKAEWGEYRKPSASVWYPDSGDAKDAEGGLYFLKRAMQSTPSYEVGIVKEFPERRPALVISEGGMAGNDVVEFRKYLESGGSGLVAMESAASAGVIGGLLGMGAEGTVEKVPAGHARFGEIDFESPVFAPFADARYADFSRIRIWRYRALPEEMEKKGTVIARYDTGDAAWIVYQTGEGVLNVFTSSWRPVDSQLALTTKFAPLLHAMLERAAGSVGVTKMLVVGDELELPEGERKMTMPGGEIVEREEGKTGLKAMAPGLYRSGTAVYPVQVEPEESEVTPMTKVDLNSLNLPMKGLPDATVIAEMNRKVTETEEERRQKWSWWLLLGAALLFVAESTLSSAFPRKIPARS